MKPITPSPPRQPIWLATAAFIAATLVLAGHADASSSSLASDLAAALGKHEAAQTLEDELTALEEFERVAAEYQDEWLPRFWTSYLHTQVARLVRRQQEDPAAHLDAAQKYHDDAVKLLDRDAGREASSLYALQALIYQFAGWSKVEETRQTSLARSRDQLNAAIKADPDNPAVLVFIGTELVSEGDEENRLASTLGGKLLLEEAQQRFAADPIERALTTAFNSEWLPFWIPWAEENLSK